MTDVIGGFDVVLGTSGADSFDGSASREVFFGLAGDDRFSNTSFEGESYFVGGTGDDTYVASPDSFTIVHETGGDGGDEFVDSIVTGAGDPLVATVDGRHLLFNYVQTGTAILFVDWEQPENQIEIFRLYDGSGLVGITFEELRDQIEDLPGFVGDVGLESLGLVEDLEDGIELLVEAVDTETLPGGLTTEEAQTVALLYEAGLGRAAEFDGLNFWIDQRENGLDDLGLAELFVQSEEFTNLVGDVDSISDEDLVEALYVNVLERQGEPEGVAFWTEFAAEPETDAATLLLAFASADENRNAADNLDGLSEIVPGVWDFV